MNTPQQPYWFHAKRYGWGWGLPATWQGWVVLVTWFVLIIIVSPILALRSIPSFIVFITGMSAVLLAICFAKGEPPKWRWGKG
jgi:lipoprotein signal peptidase